MKFKKLSSSSLILLLFACCVVQAGSYTAKVSRIQAEGIGDDFNVIYPNIDISDSPCARTNNENRLTIKNDAQLSVALAALMADKEITVQGSSNCNSAGLEIANYIMIYRDK